MGVEYLETLRNTHPELSDRFNSLADLYQKKLWHQLTEKLEEFIALAVFQVSGFLSFSSFILIVNLDFGVCSADFHWILRNDVLREYNEC